MRDTALLPHNGHHLKVYSCHQAWQAETCRFWLWACICSPRTVPALTHRPTNQAGMPLDSIAVEALAPRCVTQAQGSQQTWRCLDDSVLSRGPHGGNSSAQATCRQPLTVLGSCLVQGSGQAVLGAHLQRLGALVDQVPHQNHGIAAMAVLAPAPRCTHTLKHGCGKAHTGLKWLKHHITVVGSQCSACRRHSVHGRSADDTLSGADVRKG